MINKLMLLPYGRRGAKKLLLSSSLASLKTVRSLLVRAFTSTTRNYLVNSTLLLRLNFSPKSANDAFISLPVCAAFHFELRRFIALSAPLNAEQNEQSDDVDGTSNVSKNEKKRDRKVMAFLFGLVLMAVAVSLMTGAYQTRITNQLTVNDLLTHIIPTGEVQQILVTSNNVARVIMNPVPLKNLPFTEQGYVMFRPGVGLQKIYIVTTMNAKKLEADIREIEASLGRTPEQWIPFTVIDTSMEGIFDIVMIALLLLLLFGATKSLPWVKNSVQDMMGMKMKLNIIYPGQAGNHLKIKFKDVAGLHEAKIEVKEFVDYLKHPERYMKLGAKLPKGALLTGPPGCGKTYLAKALAAESSVPFISMNGTEFVEMIGGLGASRIRNLFKTAKKMAPCIIYVDEIDAIGRKRSQSGSAAGGGNREEEQTLNQLLVEMDGISSGRGVVLLGSTNRADILDKALLRPGRFDRHIVVDLPTASERQELFELYLQKVKLDHVPSYYSTRLAQMTPCFSGADIANIVNEAAIKAASLKKKEVTIDELDSALQRVLAGAEKRSRTLIAEEREIIAYHESGHALIGWLLEHTDALLKVSIIPRTSAKLGFAQYSPRERKLFNKQELFDRMCMMLGGRAAENVMFGRVTTGAQDDLKTVTKSAYAQVQMYGMNENLGPISFPISESKSDAELYRWPFSKKLQQLIDQEAAKLVAKAYFTAEQLLKENKSSLKKLAESLLKNEVLSYEDVTSLIGPPRFPKHVIELTDHLLPNVTGSSSR